MCKSFVHASQNSSVTATNHPMDGLLNAALESLHVTKRSKNGTPFGMPFSLGGKGGIRLPAGRAVPRENHPLDGFLTRGLRILSIHTKNQTGIPFGIPSLFGGKGGIRTLGRVLADTRFPVVRLRPAQPPFRTQALTLYHDKNKKSTPFLRLIKKFFDLHQNPARRMRNPLTNPGGKHIINR